MSQTFEITIDGKKVMVDDTMTIVEAAKKVNIHIPVLCYHPDLAPTSNCGLCVVEVNGHPQPKRACSAPCTPNMTVVTNNAKIRDFRKTLIKLLLSDHDVTCPTCAANEKCELQKVANDMSVQLDDRPPLLVKKPKDESGIALIRDPNKCIACGRCITICNDIQEVNALTFANRGFVGTVETAFGKGIAKSPCVNCGQCIIYCPTGALSERSEVDDVWKAILDKDKHVIVQEAPAIRVSLADEFGLEVGEITTEKMYAALKAIGFDSVMDTNFSADLTIMEEGTELVARLKSGNKRPMITSCSPGWVKFIETYYPDLVDCLSTAKSPMSMFGVLAKTYYPKQKNIDPAKIVSVAIMPCTAKKFEARRPELSDSGFQDTDYVLTTREFVRMIKEVGFDFRNAETVKPDEGMSCYSGAGTIFGVTGGVMEAALRSAYMLVTGKELENVEVKAVRGLEGIKEATINIPGFGDLKIAVAHSLGKARKLMDKIRKQLNETGTSDYHFIEVMACKGGCVGGGGQPLGNGVSKRAKRAEGLYTDDKKAKFRRSHENPEITKVYKEFLGEPNGELAHKLLHTYYYKRSQAEGNVVEQVTHKGHH
ncbi:MAG: NADH-dependent [FeFe] hydrogenase, group A6 [Candidatus Cloacimonetes bacterium]|nr:NADH-dependent [FeFe] hydrogenase, group A6 [Candidatus Cloacimonadota bacterium]